MDALIPAMLPAALGAVMYALVLLARRIRRRGTAGLAIAAAMAAYDEGFRPTAYESFVEMREQSERSQQAPARAPRDQRGMSSDR
jgi:hypothetical protein